MLWGWGIWVLHSMSDCTKESLPVWCLCVNASAWLQSCVGSDIIYTERRGQSQKPEEIYQLIEELVPGGMGSPEL